MEKNIEAFLKKSSDIIGKYHKDTFYGDTKCEFEDLDIKSPVEQLLYCAFQTLKEINGIEGDDPFEVDGKMYLHGLGILPQEKIGKYRVDFLITKHFIDHKIHAQAEKSVIVECDSQTWHERTEKERRYEKRRDRYLQTKGYEIFHYTGKEIMENPFKIAKEAIDFIYNYEIETP